MSEFRNGVSERRASSFTPENVFDLTDEMYQLAAA